MTSSQEGTSDAAVRLRALGRRRAATLNRLDQLEAELAKAVRRAAASGIGPTEISRLAKLSRPTVYKMKERR